MENCKLQKETPVLKRELFKPKLFKLRLEDRLTELEVACVGEISSLYVILKIHLARDA